MTSPEASKRMQTIQIAVEDLRAEGRRAKAEPQRILAGVRRARARSTRTRWVVAATAVAIVAAVALGTGTPAPNPKGAAIAHHPRPPVEAPPLGVPIVLGAGARLNAFDVEIAAVTDVRFTWSARDVLRFERGDGTVRVDDLARASTLRVWTESARIEMLGREVALKVEPDGTWVRAVDGSVRITRRNSPTVERTLGAGVPGWVPTLPAVAPLHSRGPVAKIEDVEDERVVEARRLVRTDAARARRLVDTAIESGLSREGHVQALLVRADARRRTGDLVGAAADYERVSKDPVGAPYREEADLWRAKLYVELNEPRRALALLDAASGAAFDTERRALAILVCLELSDTAGALARLERTSDFAPPTVRAHLEVAKAIVATDPDRAAQIVSRLRKEPILPANEATLRAMETEIERRRAARRSGAEPSGN